MEAELEMSVALGLLENEEDETEDDCPKRARGSEHHAIDGREIPPMSVFPVT